MLAATVVALARVAFSVFIGQLAALGRHDCGGGVVFAGNQLDVVFLAGILGQDGGPQFGIGLFDEDSAVVHGSPLRQ